MSWVPRAMQRAAAAGLLQPHHPAARDLFFMWNMDAVRTTARQLQAAFPRGTLHAYAAKANALQFIMEALAVEGCGCEAASIGEFVQAIKYFPAGRVVFDSPCKTEVELRTALTVRGRGGAGDAVHLNIDNFQELERVKRIIANARIFSSGDQGRGAGGTDRGGPCIGLRVNPQVGSGSMSLFSTADQCSKFGIPYEAHDDIIRAFKECPWLSALHVHTGSQGCGMDLMVEGVAKVRTINIGGGLPVDFTTDAWTPPFVEYATRLRERCPGLYDRRLITEFGRALLAKTGVMVSKVEYTKEVGGRVVATQHAGVDICIRTVWAPEAWPLRIDCYGADGGLIDGGGGGDDPTDTTRVITDVAGPCCLGGDKLAHQRLLPRLEPGDYIVAKDVGAYYHSSYSYYNLRQAPALFAYEPEADALVLKKDGTQAEETAAFMDTPLNVRV